MPRSRSAILVSFEHLFQKYEDLGSNVTEFLPKLRKFQKHSRVHWSTCPSAMHPRSLSLQFGVDLSDTEGGQTATNTVPRGRLKGIFATLFVMCGSVIESYSEIATAASVVLRRCISHVFVPREGRGDWGHSPFGPGPQVAFVGPYFSGPQNRLVGPVHMR